MFEIPRQNYLQSGVSLERREGRLKRKRKLKTVITFVMTVSFLHPSFNTRFTSRPIGSHDSFKTVASIVYAKKWLLYGGLSREKRTFLLKSDPL